MPRKTVPTLKPPAAVERARQRVQALAPQPAKATPWYRIEASDSGEAVVYLHDEIGYWGRTSADFVAELSGHRNKRLRVHINSPGGDVFDGIAIFNALAGHPKRVTTHVDGLAASAASFIALAGDEVIIEPNAMVMVHDASGIGAGNAADMREYADLLDKCSDIIAGIYAQRAGGTVAEWRRVMAKDRWYSADEALSVGLVTQVAARSDFSAAVANLVNSPFQARIHRDTTFAQIAAGLTSKTKQQQWDDLMRGLGGTP